MIRLATILLLTAATAMRAVSATPAPPEQPHASAMAAFVEQPRAAAYFVGDLLIQRVLLRNGGIDLNPATLPTPGRVSAWFDRRKITLETDASSRPWLAVQYQVLNAPQKLTPVTLPGWTLAVKSPRLAANAVLTIPPAKINVAPLSPPGSPIQVGVSDLRPDRLAPLISEAPIRRAITFSASALALTLAAWLGWALWRNHRANNTQPFARALRELRGLDDREPRAWQILHRAFDRTAGRVIQPATLPELFERAPQLTPLRERIEQFFTQSSVLFFSAPRSLSLSTAPGRATSTAQPVAPSSAPVSPHALCEALRRIERRYER